ncbi:MAG: PQQ-dependent sugar dehydrogenase [Agriterribacter sp.]
MKFFLFLFLLVSTTVNAQKGLPPEKIVDITHTTNYAQHVDFTDSMVKQLVPIKGWKVKVAAKGLGKPRMLLQTQKDRLYITRRDVGDVLLLTDTDSDHVFDQLKTVVTEFKGVHGIAQANGWLYLCSNRELRRYPMQDDGMMGPPETLMKDLPDGGQHGNRTMHFGPDGYLYMSIGSTCNDCAETNKENATMLQVDTTTWKRTVFARGLRNTIGFDFHPDTKLMFGVDNGADAKGSDWPPEELNMIAKDGDYGWPLVYAKKLVDETREDPPGTTKAAYAKNTTGSLLEFPAHMAPIEFRFLDAAQALVCWHGSWDKKDPDGFKVQLIRFSSGNPQDAQDFLTGFLNKKARTRFGRPAGLCIADPSTVYISDDANGILYCMEKLNP